MIWSKTRHAVGRILYKLTLLYFFLPLHIYQIGTYGTADHGPFPGEQLEKRNKAEGYGPKLEDSKKDNKLDISSNSHITHISPTPVQAKTASVGAFL